MRSLLLIYLVIVPILAMAVIVLSQRPGLTYSKKLLLAALILIGPPALGMFSPLLVAFVNAQFLQFEPWDFGYNLILPIFTFMFCFICNLFVAFVFMCIAAWSMRLRTGTSAP